MKYALIADIHANQEALTAVLARIQELGVAKIYCLGDIVGYNASPRECIELVRGANIFCLAGNHDRYVVGGVDDSVRGETREVIDYTRAALTPEQLKWLKGLPDQHVLERNWLLVHGSPSDRDEYMLDQPQWTKNLKEMKKTYFGLDLCFFGHTHYPVVVSKTGAERDFQADRTVALKAREIYLINPGSVGQPRDRCPKASFCVFDTEPLQVSFYRVAYDIGGAQSKIAEAGLARKLAERLAVGR